MHNILSFLPIGVAPQNMTLLLKITTLMSPRKTILKLGLSLFLNLPLVSRRVTLGTSLKTNLAKGLLWMLVLSLIGFLVDPRGGYCACICRDGLPIHFFSIGYVEFRSVDLVEKAIALSGTVVMGLPIVVQLTESERNRLHPGDGSGALFYCCI